MCDCVPARACACKLFVIRKLLLCTGTCLLYTSMHTKKVIDERWSNEGILEDAVEQLVINLGTGSSDSNDSGSDISGVTLLD